MKSVRLFVVGAALCSLFTAINPAFAQGTAFTYQGFLNDGGSPANGSYDLTFAAYDAPISGTLLGGIVTSAAVAIKNGVFSTTVDFGGGVFTGENLWLEIAVSPHGAGTFTAVAPRQTFMPTPYTIYAGTAGTANTVASSAVSAVQLHTSGAPASGLVLGFDGTQLVWQNPVVGGSTGGWSLYGNLGTTPGVNFLGTLDSQPLELKVSSRRALRLEPNASGAPNVIGGASVNFVSNSVVGAVIGGGGALSYAGLT
jgi:hypothetical protein